jgi:6-phosphofructokinase 1
MMMKRRNPIFWKNRISKASGFSAVEALMAGKTGVMAGLKNNNVAYTPFDEAIKKSKSLNKELLRMAHILAQ